MAKTLTVVDTFSCGMWNDEPRFRVAFNSTGTYCAVGVMNDYDINGVITGNAEVWVFKLAAGHWSKVGTLVTNGYWDSTEAWAVAISDDLTVLAVGPNSAVIHRWKSTGSDTWAADSYFQPFPTDNAGYSYLAFSSDGNVLWTCNDYNGSAPGKIITGIAGSHTVRQTWSDATYNPMGGALSADGKRLAFANLILNRLEIWNSTTLGTSSWSVGGTVSFSYPVSYVQNIRMTPDKAYIIVSYDTAMSTSPMYLEAFEVFHNTTGSTYVSLGVWHTNHGDNGSAYTNEYAPILSWGLSDAGLLLTTGDEDANHGWSIDDIFTGTSAGLNAPMDEVAQPSGLGTRWNGSVSVDPTGVWACVQGLGSPSVAGNDKIAFCTISAYVPVSEFWKDFVKTQEEL